MNQSFLLKGAIFFLSASPIFTSIHAQDDNSIWLRTNYNWATHLQRNPTKPEDGQTQMPFNKGIGIGLGHRYNLGKRITLESSLSYQKKGFNTVMQVGEFNPIRGQYEVSEITLSDNYHFVDWAEVVWFDVLKKTNITISIGGGIGLGALVDYKKGSDFVLLNQSSQEHMNYIYQKPNPIAPFRYLGIQLGIKDRFKIGFDNKNDIGWFVKAQGFEAKNWVWSLNINYLIGNIKS